MPDRSNRSVAALAAALVSCASWAVASPQSPGMTPKALASVWDAEHISSPFPQLVIHEDVVQRLSEARRAAPDLFSLEEIGKSVEGRSINHIWFGHGKFRVLMWSQMHGNEPHATSALFDVLEYFAKHRSDEPIQRILDQLTVHVVPMLNPDGAARWQRANAMGIDINRDALRLTTPEGRILKALRDRLQPQIGFNLHNQGWRTSSGEPPRPAAISLLAVAYDKELSENEGRLLAKRVCSVIADALQPFAPGYVAKYDETFNPRAFGDNVTMWGTPVVLIETGGYPEPPHEPQLVRLNFIAVMSSLDALATGRVHEVDKARYDSLEENQSQMLYLLFRNVSIVNGIGIPPFVSDVGVGANRRVRVSATERQLVEALSIDDLGDLSFWGAYEIVDGTGLTLAPAFGFGHQVGDIVQLPDWKQMPSERTIATGQPADLFLLEPSGKAGSFRIRRIITATRTIGSVSAPSGTMQR
ncbi:MAG: M14 family zinc carboxypeptidase [Vicinamibacterales bacterium]